MSMFAVAGKRVGLKYVKNNPKNMHTNNFVIFKSLIMTIQEQMNRGNFCAVLTFNGHNVKKIICCFATINVHMCTLSMHFLES